MTDPVKSTHVCTLCGKECRTKAGLAAHIRYFHDKVHKGDHHKKEIEERREIREEKKVLAAQESAQECIVMTVDPPEPPEDVTPEEEPVKEDTMFAVDYSTLDPFGLPTDLYTKSRLIDQEQALKQAEVDTNFILYSMGRSIYGDPAYLLIPLEQIAQGRPLNGFEGNPMTQITIAGKEYIKVSKLTYPQIKKMRFLLHTISTELGKARWEEIQKNAISVDPNGIPTAPPAIMYPNAYSQKKAIEIKQKFKDIAKGEE